MTIDEVKTLGEVAKEYNKSLQTLHSRLKHLIEHEDYRKVPGKRQPVLLTPAGVEKIIRERR